MNNITVTNKRHTTYVFYIKHNMHAVDWNSKKIFLKIHN